MASFYLNLSEEQKNYVEKYWGDVRNIGDDKAQEIVEELLDGELNEDDVIKTAFWSDEESIFYEIEDKDEDEDDMCREWSERYLNSLGMSMRDFY